MGYEVIEDRLWDSKIKPVLETQDYMEAKVKAKELNKRQKNKYIMREVLETRELEEYTAKVYAFRFQHGWANFTICDRLGEFSIQSDWGNYSYRWGNIGKNTLEEFLAGCDSCYITTKLSYSKPREFREEFSLSGTIDNVKTQIIEERRSGQLEKRDARILWDYTEKVLKFSDDAETPEGFYNLIHEPVEYFNSRMGEFVEIESLISSMGPDFVFNGASYEPSARYLFCQNTLIPFFTNFLREKLNARETNKEERDPTSES